MNLELKRKAQKIKVVAFDVDGVMTDGSLTFLEDGREIKTFNAKDGQGIVSLNRAGLKTAIITARDNATVQVRFETLGMHSLYKGQKNKAEAFEKLLVEHNVSADEVAYMGDDLPDICVLKQVGLACCPADAVDEVKEIAYFVSSKNGGRGAVRELCDLILKNQKKEENVGTL